MTVALFAFLCSWPLPLSLQVALGQEEVLQSDAQSCLEKCSPDVLAIIRHIMSIMDLSGTDLSPIPGRALRDERNASKLFSKGCSQVGEAYACDTISDNAQEWHSS